MTSIRTAAAAAFVVLALSAPASAQDKMMMENNGAMVVMPDGQMRMMSTMDEGMMNMAMKGAEEVEDGTIFFMSGGKLYMVQDMKMENGRMMTEEMMSE